MCPSPARGQRFRLLDRALDLATGAATFDYELDGDRFTERVGLPAGDREPDPAALDLLLDVAHAAIGTSYYKLTAPQELAVERPVGQTVAGLIRQIYDDGLRELAVTNGLPVPLDHRPDRRGGGGPPRHQRRAGTRSVPSHRSAGARTRPRCSRSCPGRPA